MVCPNLNSPFRGITQPIADPGHPLWGTNQPSDTRGEQLEDRVIAHSASLVNDGAANLLNFNRATDGLTSQTYP